MTASLASLAARRFAWPLALLLAACTPPDELQGVAKPPPEWGALDISRFGCPDLSGMYQASPADARGSRYNYGHMWPFPPAGSMQYWVSGPNDKLKNRLELRARLVGASRFGYHPRDWEWKSKGLANSQWGCKRGWVVLEEISIGLPSAQEWHGGTDVLVGARLGRLADGSLAVGQWMRVTGRTGSIGWGDTVFFTTRSGDRVAWHWQKLERVGASGEGVPPPPAEPRREERRARVLSP